MPRYDNKIIVRYDTTGLPMDMFNTVKQASIKTGMKENTIYNAMRYDRIMTDGTSMAWVDLGDDE